MSEPVYLHLFEPLLESGFFLVLVFMIALMPYVAGYYGKTRQQHNLGIEFLFRIGSVLASASLAVLFFQTYLPLPESWQQDQSIMVLTNIASVSVGIVIWKISYSIGGDRAIFNMTDRKELSRIIVDDDLRPIIKEAADSIMSEIKSKTGSLEENISKLSDLIESKFATTEEQIHDHYEIVVESLITLERTITERIRETPVPQNSDSTEPVPEQDEPPEEQRRKGLEARLTGEEIQSDVHAMVRMKASHGEETVCSYEQGEPDIIITRDGKLADVIAVKSYTLTVTDRKGMRNVRGQKVAVSFCPSRDAKAETEYARNHGLEHIHLIAVNIATRRMIFNDMVEFDQTITLRDVKEDS